MSVRENACAAFKRSVAEKYEANRAAEQAERLRHYDGARAKMEALFSISEAGPNSGWACAPASFVDHERRIARYYRHPYLHRTTHDTVTQRAVEFLVEGLRFRVTETQPRREALERMTWSRGVGGLARVKERYPEYGYEVYVYLPESEKPWYRLRPRWYWQHVSTQETLGALLAKRGMCCPSGQQAPHEGWVR